MLPIIIELAFLSAAPFPLMKAGSPATFIVTAVRLPNDVGAVETSEASFKSEASRGKKVLRIVSKLSSSNVSELRP